VERPVPSFAAVAGRARDEIVLKAVNGAEAPVAAEIRLAGIAAVESKAEAVLLTSASLDDENSLDQPTRVSPGTLRVTAVAPGFDYTFPARSLTVLRLKVKRP
jgi:alpha-L-arabinofuranosidase